MVRPAHKSFRADDRSYYAILKKEIHRVAEDAGFNEQKLAGLDIVLAELTSNLNKYAIGGEILCAVVENDGNPYIELLCIDNGPGIRDPGKMMADGFSTSSTLGHGLGSISRISDVFELYSLRDWGTISLCRIFRNGMPATPPASRPVIRHVIVPKPGEELSGDGMFIGRQGDSFRIMVGDGLGHGIEANLAVKMAAEAMANAPGNTIDAIRHLHNEIRKSRGMVANVLYYDASQRRLSICGVGNISGKLFGAASSKNFVPYNGIIGHNIPRSMTEQVFAAGEYSTLVFCSDGLKSRWDTSRYAGIQKYDATILAAALYKDYARETDDRSVLICKLPVT